MANSITGSNNIQVVAKGDVHINKAGEKPTPKGATSKTVITMDQCHNINAIADGFGLLNAELRGDNVAPLLKHIAFTACGVKSIRAIPASKYIDALNAMQDYIHKHSKYD